ncbi:hypothetical protein [Taibaiella chishuiensis]|nr:hypothetical protein [Taibaiella chishuiensis]
MNFNDKLANFFSKFSLVLGDKPTRKLIYLYADYIELVSLFSNDNFVSASDILDRFKDEGLLQRSKEDSEQASLNDEDERFVDSIYRLLIERSQLFETDYPFIVEGIDKIKLKPVATISSRQKIYLYLLIASSLNIFKDFQPELTKEFEILSAAVLRNFLPAHAVVKSFGKTSDYNGSAVEKIKALAQDLKVSLDEHAFGEISERGNQEKGLDLIGWIPFSDNVPNFLAILVQCACGKDWNKKLHETSRYNNYMRFHRLNPVHSMFIPYSLISFAKKSMARNDEINERLIFERKRILNYTLDVVFFDDLDSKQLIDQCIKFEEDIV